MPTHPLHYAKPKNKRRRTLIKWSLLAIPLTTIFLTAIHYAPHAFQYARQSYWQHQCLTFDPPATIVVYERIPPASPIPPITDPYIDGNSPQVAALAPFPGKIPTDPTPFVQVCRVPICWTQFMRATQTSTVFSFTPAVLFCHQLTSPAGHRRLVTVEYEPMDGCFGDQLCDRNMQAQVFPPAAWTGCPSIPQPRDVEEWEGGMPLPQPRRIFAGQPDPADPSHFTIKYEWPSSVQGYIDGYLLDDDTVTLKIRPGPGDIPSAQQSLANHPELWPAD